VNVPRSFEFQVLRVPPKLFSTCREDCQWFVIPANQRKSQAPSSKLQRISKVQTPNQPNELLEFGVSLELGPWSLEL
jgi:hypothetical protein